MSFVFFLLNILILNFLRVKCIIWWPSLPETNNNVILGNLPKISSVALLLFLVPGYLGNQLDYTDNRIFSPLRCVNPSLTTLNTLWFDPYKIIFCQKYWLEIARLFYSKETKMSSSVAGVTVNVPKMGDAHSMAYVAPFPYYVTDSLYFHKLITCLRIKGFREGRDLYGAARDHRKGPNEISQHFADLKALVEQSYAKNGKKVILVAHSIGGNIAHIFLVRQTTEWKNKYIRSFVSIATPYGGGFKNVYGFLFDDDPPASQFKIVRQAQRTWTTSTFAMPNEITWNSTVFIQTPSKNYTIADFCDFFNKINYPIGCSMYIDSMVPEIATLPHPNTNVYCLGGLGQQTPLKLIYADDDFKTAPTKVYGDGDTFVNREAMEKCLLWKDKGYEFSYKTFNTDHLGLVHNDEPVNFICNAVASMSK